ncbi:MAG TPA: hypothetical protein PKW59_12385 [Thermotogota bacterium]|nr:hypothetical protein [Thermotogota bacterium]
MKQNKGVLLLYHAVSLKNASTIFEHINSFPKYSKFKFYLVNTELGFPKILKNNTFDCIILHYSLFGRGYKYELQKDFLDYLLLAHSSVKVVFFQDEYHFCQKRFEFINQYNIDYVYTLVEPNYFKLTYEKYTNAKNVFWTIPGFVDDTLINKAVRFCTDFEKRQIDFFYRGRKLPLYMGKGSQEKYYIAGCFSKLTKNEGFTLDIETNEKRRLYGDNWYKALAKSKAVLGVEAGVSLFDIDGSAYKAYQDYLQIHNNPSEEDIFKLLEPWENLIFYRTISPRIFEAAAFRNVQILFEGNYSNLITPYKHYIPLKKDFSNYDEVISLFKNRRFCKEMTDTAYDDLIKSGKYSYKTFITEFDNRLLSCGLNNEKAQGTENYSIKTSQILRYPIGIIKSAFYVQFPGRKKIVAALRKHKII